MKTLIEKAKNRSIEIQEEEWLPLGQRVIKNGYRQITKEEIWEMFGVGRLFCFHDQVNHCSLQTYTKDVIPLKQIQDILKAKNIGIKKFGVYWPKDKSDPVVVGFVGFKEFFITKW